MQAPRFTSTAVSEPEPEPKPELEPAGLGALLGAIRYGDELVVQSRQTNEVYALGEAGFCSAVSWRAAEHHWVGSRMSLVACVDGMIRGATAAPQTVCYGDTVALKAVATGEFLCEDPVNGMLTIMAGGGGGGGLQPSAGAQAGTF